MFERFTEEARAVVVLAQDEATALEADRIGAEHLLLGLAAEQGAAARVLEPLGLGHAALRAELE
jgi:ATP-dependent Clp protease ATP-binding subunit ClpA